MLVKRILLLCFSLSLFSSVLLGQAAENQITGILIDAGNGETLIGANVVAVNQSTGYSNGVITDSDGRFVIRDLPLGGPYSVRVSYIGYTATEITGNFLRQGDYLNLGIIEMESGPEDLEEIVISYDAFRSDRRRLGTARL